MLTVKGPSTFCRGTFNFVMTVMFTRVSSPSRCTSTESYRSPGGPEAHLQAGWVRLYSLGLLAACPQEGSTAEDTKKLAPAVLHRRPFLCPRRHPFYRRRVAAFQTSRFHPGRKGTRGLGLRPRVSSSGPYSAWPPLAHPRSGPGTRLSPALGVVRFLSGPRAPRSTALNWATPRRGSTRRAAIPRCASPTRPLQTRGRFGASASSDTRWGPMRRGP